MRFHESGLPNDKLIEEAFNFSFATIMANQKDALKSFQAQINAMHAENMHGLDMARRSGDVKDDEYKMQKDMLEKMRDDQLKAGPSLISQELGRVFEQRRLAPAKEIADNADGVNPALISAILLVDTVRSPLDFQNVEKRFGTAVAGLVAEVLHIDAYPSERDVTLAKAAPDSKRAYMALLITTINQISSQIEQALKANPMQKIMLPPGQEEQMFANAKTMWGVDKKLDARFLDVFNKAADIVSSPFKVELDASGAPELVRDATPARKGPKPTGPKPPGGNGGLGGDVF